VRRVGAGGGGGGGGELAVRDFRPIRERRLSGCLGNVLDVDGCRPENDLRGRQAPARGGAMRGGGGGGGGGGGRVGAGGGGGLRRLVATTDRDEPRGSRSQPRRGRVTG